MTTMLVAAALLCGIPIGLIVGVVLGASLARKIRASEDFDGGFNASNPPPARTIIWFGEGYR